MEVKVLQDVLARAAAASAEVDANPFAVEAASRSLSTLAIPWLVASIAAVQEPHTVPRRDGGALRVGKAWLTDDSLKSSSPIELVLWADKCSWLETDGSSSARPMREGDVVLLLQLQLSSYCGKASLKATSCSEMLVVASNGVVLIPEASTFASLSAAASDSTASSPYGAGGSPSVRTIAQRKALNDPGLKPRVDAVLKHCKQQYGFLWRQQPRQEGPGSGSAASASPAAGGGASIDLQPAGSSSAHALTSIEQLLALQPGGGGVHSASSSSSSSSAYSSPAGGSASSSSSSYALCSVRVRVRSLL